jgi:hypothetical protein
MISQVNNLKQFGDVITRAYAEAKQKGLIPNADISLYDKLVYAGPVCYDTRGGWSRPVPVHRIWRGRVARLYYRQNPRTVRGFFDELDWAAIYQWILDNIIPIVKMLLVIIPFLI